MESDQEKDERKRGLWLTKVIVMIEFNKHKCRHQHKWVQWFSHHGQCHPQRPTRPLCSLPGRPRYDEGTTFELPILVVDHLHSTPWRHGLVEGPGFF